MLELATAETPEVARPSDSFVSVIVANLRASRASAAS
jgi:hypothetical protein